MDDTIVTLFCLCDDFLKARHHWEDPQQRMSDSEVMTTALIAAHTFGGNLETARQFLGEKPSARMQAYVPRMLSASRLNRRLHTLQAVFVAFFETLGDLWKRLNPDALYLVDSFPVRVCEHVRAPRRRLYSDEVYRGYNASKRSYFIGLKVHWIITATGHPVECFFSPGSFQDVEGLSVFQFDLPPGSRVVGDKAYNHYAVEDTLQIVSDISLEPIRKKNLTRKVPGYVEYVRSYERKSVETAISLVQKQFPKSIHAVTEQGFALKVLLFVLAYSICGML